MMEGSSYSSAGMLYVFICNPMFFLSGEQKHGWSGNWSSVDGGLSWFEECRLHNVYIHPFKKSHHHGEEVHAMQFCFKSPSRSRPL